MSEHLQYQPSYLERKEVILNESLTFFFGELPGIAEQYVLELGTKRWGPKPTHHKALFPNARRFVMSDVVVGQDVDRICNAHALSSAFPQGEINVLWASSVWEHLKYPWIAASEVLKILPAGGLFFIQTHLAFPEHGYPEDYFRFTRRGLESLFSGASELVSCYDYPADLSPRNKEIDWNAAAPNFLNVNLAGKK